MGHFRIRHRPTGRTQPFKDTNGHSQHTAVSRRLSPGSWGAAPGRWSRSSSPREADTSSKPACSCRTTSAAVGTRRVCVHGPVAEGCRLGITVTNLATLAVNGTVEGVGRSALDPIAFANVPERSSAFVGAS